MVFQTLLLASVAAFICFAESEDGWKVVPLKEDLPIDFETDNLQLRTIGFGNPSTRYNQIFVVFNSGEDMKTGGMQILFENSYEGGGPATTWLLESCGAAGSKEGAKGVFSGGAVNNEDPDVNFYYLEGGHFKAELDGQRYRGTGQLCSLGRNHGRVL